MSYNESLFDFVFIPHDFRHGDIVRSLYGGWNTTEFCEKVGIILNYSDKDYEFYKNLKGDYSDVQVCVDIKFDGVAYQGEFEHEHINPIYIERIGRNFAVVNREDWSYKLYEYRNDITSDYDDMFVYGIGMEDNFDESDKNIIKALEKRKYDSYLNKRMVIVLSNTARSDIDIV